MNRSIKQSGILLHPTALPGPYGIGELGTQVYRFIDMLEKMGQTLWQVLPLGPTDDTFSPYSSSSAFAGNPYLISIELLLEYDLIEYADIKTINFSDKHIDTKKIDSFKMNLLFIASNNFLQKIDTDLYKEYEMFCKENSYWLDDYAHYSAMKINNKGLSWNKWQNFTVKNDQIESVIKVIQFLFDFNWKKIRSYAKDKGIQIIGDMPIYVSYDSCDVWSNRELFKLDVDGNMLYEAGCPPCDYNIDGQHWGMPVYNWDKHMDSDFEWWKNRFKRMFSMLDIIRIDHFIGFSRYYSIPINHTAKDGFWSDSPGDKLLSALSIDLNSYDIFAEDLGDITQDVIDLRDKFELPGIRVLQFDLNDIVLNNDYSSKTVLYTGTHDNDTLVGWLESLNYKQKKIVFDKFSAKDTHWKLIEFAMSRVCDRVIIPLQDILGLGSRYRFNTPGLLSEKNWVWRFNFEDITDSMINSMKEITENSNRFSYIKKGIIS